jgi:ribosome biogenesis GTPase
MIYRAVGIPTIATSIVSGQGMEELKEVLREKNSLVVGQSGVGKSSLLNAADPRLNLRIGEISEASLKGRHTTSAVEMHPLSCGGYVVDTPGLKYLGLWEVKAEELQVYFPEMSPFLGKCRFRDCLHQSEPSCAIKQGLAEGLIFKERYDSYLNLLQELQTESP